MITPLMIKVLADIVVILHLLWILFLIFGAFLGKRFKVVRIVHVSGMVFSVILQLFKWYCPLTHLEVWLRSKHNPELSYSGSFIIHYIEKIVYIELSPALIFFLSILIFGINLWLYLRKK